MTAAVSVMITAGIVFSVLFESIRFFEYLQGVPILVMVLLGLADCVLDIRQTIANWRGPPAPT